LPGDDTQAGPATRHLCFRASRTCSVSLFYHRHVMVYMPVILDGNPNCGAQYIHLEHKHQNTSLSKKTSNL